MSDTKRQVNSTRLTGISAGSFWWLLATAVAAAIVVGTAAAEILDLIAVPLAMLFVALTLATALAPLVSRLETRMPRLAASLLVLAGLIVVLGGLAWAIVPSFTTQIRDLGSHVPDLIERARQFIDRWGGEITPQSIASQVSNLGPTLLRLPLTVTSVLSGILLILFASFYMLLEAAGIENFFLSLFPEQRRTRVKEVAEAMGRAMGGYARGVAINGAIVGLVTFIGLLLLGVNYALALGILAGLLELIPVVGPIVAGIIIVGLTLLQMPGQAIWVLIFVVVLQQLENNILVPNIMETQTKLSPLMSILALVIGGAIGGILGALIAIPIAAALHVLVEMVIAPAIRRQTGAEPEED